MDDPVYCLGQTFPVRAIGTMAYTSRFSLIRRCLSKPTHVRCPEGTVITELHYTEMQELPTTDEKIVYPNWCCTKGTENVWWTRFNSMIVGVLQYHDMTHLVAWINHNTEAAFTNGGWQLEHDEDIRPALRTEDVMTNLPAYLAEHLVL